MTALPEGPLSRREREVMEILHRLRTASAGDIRGQLEDPPTDSAVRSILRILEEKGHVRHEREGRRYIYSPRVSLDRARRSAVRNLVETFFRGSPGDAMAALLDESAEELSEAELDRLARMVEEERGGGDG